MKTLMCNIIVAALVLLGCLLVSLFRDKKNNTNRKVTNLLLPTCILLLFIGLFIGAGISRKHIKKELEVMQEENLNRHPADDSRLETLEARNREISWIIGEDEELEKWIEVLRTQ